MDDGACSRKIQVAFNLGCRKHLNHFKCNYPAWIPFVVGNQEVRRISKCGLYIKSKANVFFDIQRINLILLSLMLDCTYYSYSMPERSGFHS